MSSQPEVAITIMTGGSHGAAETGPTPMPLDQLPSADAVAAPTDAPTPLDLDELAALAAPRRRSAAKKATAKKAPAKRARR